MAIRRYVISQLLSISPAPNARAFKEARITSLPILLLNVHTHCNCRCVMCDIWKRKNSRELPAADLERHREDLVRLGVRQVVLSGGEPLLHRDLASLTSFFRELGIHVTLLTTGLLLYKKAGLVAEEFDDVIVSLDGPPAVHNAIRRIPSAFQMIARGVEAVRTLHPSLSIACRTTVQKQNHAHLRDTVASARALGLRSISFLPADLSSTAFNRARQWSSDRQDEIALNAQELLNLEAEIETLITTNEQDIRSGFIVESATKLRRLTARFHEHLYGTPPVAPKCNAPWVSTVVETDGSLRPCFFHPAVASASAQTLAEALNSDAALAFRSTLDVASNPTCRRCVCSLNYQP